jgi:hypothetical protein
MEGACTMWQAARLPRHHAISARSSIAASSRSIGFGPPCPAVDLQAAGIHHPAGDPFGCEAALQPELVVAGLVADDDLHLAAATRLPLVRLQAAEQNQQAGDVAALQPMRGGLPARRGPCREQPGQLAALYGDEHGDTIQRGTLTLNLTHRPSLCG